MLNHATELLNSVFGYPDFRGQQREVIDSALQGRDCLVLMPTGGGKSLCYQIPALVRDGMGIIVSPLIALMQDQVLALQQLGVAAAYLNSTLSAAEQSDVMSRIQQGQLSLLYVAPERLLQEATLARLQQQKVSLIAIDEAHCVSQWGHDFRQDYLSLQVLKQYFPDVPRMALTATADQRTQQEIVQRLELSSPESYVSSFDRPNIRYHVQAKGDAKAQLINFLSDHRNQAGIVYCMSRKKVESMADWLVQRGVNALPYHAGMPAEQRAEHLRRFLHEEAVVMVATVAFGMGIDKPDVRFVAHLDLPKSMEAYYQETGRAGRDGLSSDAWMVYGLQDVVRIVQMVEESNAGEQHKRHERSKIDALLGWCEVTTCRRRALLSYFDEQLEQACGNCDVCLSPPQTREATVEAQKFLSTVYRTGQRFGTAHIVDVLRGLNTDKIRQHNHQQLSTYGLGKDISANHWQSIARQLMVQGYLSNDFERFGALTLTENSRPLLRGEKDFHYREQLAEPKERKTSASRNGVSQEDRNLWEALRECRKRLADEHDLAPYMIFHDATLMQMMEEQPSTLDALSFVHGVGASKLDKYGEAFLEVIDAHAS